MCSVSHVRSSLSLVHGRRSGCTMEEFRQKLPQEGVNEQMLLILEEEDITNPQMFCVLPPQHFELFLRHNALTVA